MDERHIIAATRPDDAGRLIGAPEQYPERSGEAGTREIVIHRSRGAHVDAATVDFAFYNCFNYSLLPKRNGNVRLRMGVTSARPGEGKTLVAANLAVSLSKGYRKKTVLVDLNVSHPRIHEIFGSPLAPGLIDALHDGPIPLASTQIEYLSILSAGNGYAAGPEREGRRRRPRPAPRIDLDDTVAFSELVDTLGRSFDFVVVDMPSILSREFPILFAAQLDGLLVVVEYNKTRRSDLEKMFRLLHEQQILGFVLNRVTEEELA